MRTLILSWEYPDASEHVLTFDWGDVATQVASAYGEVSGSAASARRAARS